MAGRKSKPNAKISAKAEFSAKAEISARARIKLDIAPAVQQDALNFAKRIFGPLGELGDLFSESIRMVRFRRAVEALKCAHDICAGAGIAPKKIPHKQLFPLLEGVSFEDEGAASLAKEWAHVLATAAARPHIKYTSYGSLLKQLDGDDVRLLARMRKELSAHDAFRPERFGNARQDYNFPNSVEQMQGPGRISFVWREDEIPNTNEFSLADFPEAVRLLHLQTLGLLRIDSGDLVEPDNKRHFYLFGEITPLGHDFVSVCQGEYFS
jgi:hypothetical protein